MRFLNDVCAIEGATAADFGLLRQHAFLEWARNNFDLKPKSLSNYMGTIAAAMAMAARPRIAATIDGEEEVLILDKPVFIETGERNISNILRAPRSVPRHAVPTIKELASIIDEIEEEHVFRYVIVALNTWARPEAVCQLDFSEQVDFSRGIISLNPPGRVQTQKIRPVIPMTQNLRAWSLWWNCARPIAYQGKPVAAMSPRTLAKACLRAGVEKITAYTLRHFMATNIRNVEGIPVSREQRAQWLGHVDPDHRMTEKWYESYDADFLGAPCRATDAIMDKLHAFSKKALFAPNSLPTTGLRVVSKPLILNDKIKNFGA